MHREGTCRPRLRLLQFPDQSMRQLTRAISAAICISVPAMAGRNTSTAGAYIRAQNTQPPIGPPGRSAHYRLETENNQAASIVKSFDFSAGPIEKRRGEAYQWLLLDGMKASGARVRVWILSNQFPPEQLEDARRTVARYVLQEAEEEPKEFRNAFNGE